MKIWLKRCRWIWTKDWQVPRSRSSGTSLPLLGPKRQGKNFLEPSEHQKHGGGGGGRPSRGKPQSWRDTATAKLCTEAGREWAFPGGSVGKDPLEKEMATHSQYSCLGNPMDRIMHTLCSLSTLPFPANANPWLNPDRNWDAKEACRSSPKVAKEASFWSIGQITGDWIQTQEESELGSSRIPAFHVSIF